MGTAKLYGQSGSGGKINGIIEDYYAYAGENISAGDFVEFINGIASAKTETSSDTVLNGSTQNAGFTISAVQLDSNRVFIAHSHGSSYNLYAMVVTINGATIIAGADTYILGVNSTGREISVELLDNGNVFIAFPYAGNYYLYGTVCEISGTTITPGSMFKLSDINYTGATISTQLLDSGNVFIVHSYNTNYYLYAMVVTIDGTTITAGTDIQLSSMNYSGLNISAVTLDNNKVFIAHCYGSDYHLYGMVCSISGTTISKGSDTSLISEINSGRYISVSVLGNGKVFIAHSRLISGEYYVFGIICSISGTNISKGTDQQLCTYFAGTLSVVTLNSNKVFVVRGWYDSYYYLYGIVCTVSGTTITAGTDTQLSTDTYTGYSISSILLSDGNIFVAHSYNSSYHLYAQIWGIDEENNVPTNNVTITEYETQVRKATTSDIYGVAKTSGMGAYKVVEYTVAEGETINVGDKVEVTEGVVKGDIFPKTWTQVTTATEYVAEDGTRITASEYYSTRFNVSCVFDGDDQTFWMSNYINAGTETWVQIQLPKAIRISKMKTWIKAGTDLQDFNQAIIQGSNNGTQWNNLCTIIGSQTELTEVVLDNSSEYEFYRVVMSLNNTDSTDIIELQTSEYYGELVKKSVSSPCIALQSGTAGDTIQIAVPVSNEESTGHKDIIRVYQPYPEKRLVMADGNILTTSNGDVFLLKEAI